MLYCNKNFERNIILINKSGLILNFEWSQKSFLFIKHFLYLVYKELDLNSNTLTSQSVHEQQAPCKLQVSKYVLNKFVSEHGRRKGWMSPDTFLNSLVNSLECSKYRHPRKSQ